jgi:hypothetical protein
MKRTCWWRECKNIYGEITQWDLRLRRKRGVVDTVASVWPNGTWLTFDQNGVGGESDIEDSVKRAKIEAAASAIEQGFT